MAIETDSVFVSRINHEGARGDNLGSGQRALDGILKQARTDTGSLIRTVDRKLPQQRAGNRIGDVAS